MIKAAALNCSRAASVWVDAQAAAFAAEAQCSGVAFLELWVHFAAAFARWLAGHVLARATHECLLDSASAAFRPIIIAGCYATATRQTWNEVPRARERLLLVVHENKEWVLL